ncbi:5951_t:CDS:1, partial [Ambispora leptoticha]
MTLTTIQFPKRGIIPSGLLLTVVCAVGIHAVKRNPGLRQPNLNQLYKKIDAKMAA